MSGVKRPTDKHLMLFTGRANPELAQSVAEIMGVELTPSRLITYANSEVYVRYEESVRGSDAFVIQSHPAPVNEWLMEQLIMVDALKRASAKRITVVAPCYPYARQDKKHLGREPISARLTADLYWAAGADRIACTATKGDAVVFWDGSGRYLGHVALSKPAGIALSRDQRHFVTSNELGEIVWIDSQTLQIDPRRSQRFPVKWDNHLSLAYS